jgi:hypothetical protein
MLKLNFVSTDFLGSTSRKRSRNRRCQGGLDGEKHFCSRWSWVCVSNGSCQLFNPENWPKHQIRLSNPRHCRSKQTNINNIFVFLSDWDCRITCSGHKWFSTKACNWVSADCLDFCQDPMTDSVLTLVIIIFYFHCTDGPRNTRTFYLRIRLFLVYKWQPNLNIRKF